MLLIHAVPLKLSLHRSYLPLLSSYPSPPRSPQAQKTREHLVLSVSECQALRDESSSLTAEVASLKKKVELLDRVATETPESKRALCRILERYTAHCNYGGNLRFHFSSLAFEHVPLHFLPSTALVCVPSAQPDARALPQATAS